MEVVAAVLGFKLPPALAGEVLEYHYFDGPLPGGLTPLDFFQTMKLDSITAPSPNPPFFVDYQTVRGKKVIANTKIKTRDDLKYAKFPKLDEEYLSPLYKFVEKYRTTGLALTCRTRMGVSGVF